MTGASGDSLYHHLELLGREIPSWLTEEVEKNGFMPSKVTIPSIIYKAMISAAPEVEEMARDKANQKLIARRHYERNCEKVMERARA